MADRESEEEASMRFESATSGLWVPEAAPADNASEADTSTLLGVWRVGRAPGMTRVCARLAAGTAATVETITKSSNKIGSRRHTAQHDRLY